MSGLPTVADDSPAVWCAVCDGLRPFEVDFQASAHSPLVEVFHIAIFCKACRTLIAQQMSMSRRGWATRKIQRRRFEPRAQGGEP